MAVTLPSTKNIIGIRLREARLRAGLAQDKLGVLAGLEESSSSARMSRYESGVHEQNFAFVESVANILGIAPTYFYCTDDRLATIILAYSKMSESKRKALSKHVESLD